MIVLTREEAATVIVKETLKNSQIRRNNGGAEGKGSKEKGVLPVLSSDGGHRLDPGSEDEAEDDDKGAVVRPSARSEGSSTTASSTSSSSGGSNLVSHIAALRSREECRQQRRAAESSESCLTRLGWGGGSDCVRAIVSRLRQAGLQVKRVRSLDGQSVLLKMRAPEWRLEEEAEKMRLPMRTKVGSRRKAPNISFPILSNLNVTACQFY